MEILAKSAAKLGIQPGPRELDMFQVYYDELLEWNQRINLTTITGYEAAQINHFLDSLTIASVFNLTADTRVLDIGTGAGFPGLPLKIVFPDIKLTLMEATGKKTLFLKHLIGKLGLTQIEVLTGRAEELAHQPSYRENFDLVLSRAVAPLPVLVEYALPFCACGGTFIAHKKGDIQNEIIQAEKAIGILKGNTLEVKPIDLPEFPDRRYLVMVRKNGTTPALYPRRSGLPVKKPLV